MKPLNYKIAPKTFRRLIDDNHVRFQERSHADKFLEILNKQAPAIKHAIKFEDHKYSLNLLDIKITNNTTNKQYKLEVYQKDAVTNIHVKPNSSVNPSITKSAFECFLNRAHTINS